MLVHHQCLEECPVFAALLHNLKIVPRMVAWNVLDREEAFDSLGGGRKRIKQKVWGMRMEVGSGTSACADGCDPSAGCPGAANVVRGVADNNGVVGSKGMPRVRCRSPERQAWQFVAVGVITAKRAEWEVRVKANALQLVPGHRFHVAGEQAQLYIIPTCETIKQIVYPWQVIDFVGANGVLGALHVVLNDVLEDRIRSSDPTCVQYVSEDSGISPARKGDPVGRHGASGHGRYGMGHSGMNPTGHFKEGAVNVKKQ